MPLPPCFFRAITDIPCATCGSTRAVLALLHGDILAALAFNPGVVLSAVFLSAMLARGLWLEVRTGKFPVWFSAHRGFPAVKAGWIAVALIAANWIYVLWHENLC